MNSFMIDQILLHALEKNEQLPLLLGCHLANAIANIDEEVGNPGKQAPLGGIGVAVQNGSTCATT